MSVITERKRIQNRRSQQKRTDRPTIGEAWQRGNPRKFIGWDGEGSDYYVCYPDGTILALHRYILFGCSAERKAPLTGMSLGATECLDYLLYIHRKYPDTYNVSFSFSYDVNMILAELPLQAIRVLNKYGACGWKGYHIRFIPGKMFYVRNRKDDSPGVTVYDIFSFFNCSFIRAIEKFDVSTPELDLIREGKSRRGYFTYADIDYVIKYWSAEIDCLPPLADKIRDAAYASQFYISKWHGPGALAAYLLKKNGVRKLMSDEAKIPQEVKHARQYAYAGGRFSPFMAGIYYGTVYTLDFNSAYVAAARNLPRLDNGRWVHRAGNDFVQAGKTVAYDRVPDFGLYRIEYNYTGKWASRRPHPLFHRDKRSMLSWPSRTRGWYWGPEANAALSTGHATLLEAWVYMSDGTLPFKDWIEKAYAERLALQEAEDPAEKTYKWALAAIYGLWARRVGWDRVKRLPPATHQLEWAGYITSWCRAQVYQLAVKAWNISRSCLISIDTDGITVTRDLGLDDEDIGEGLGQLKKEEYTGIIQWQPGIYWLRGKDGEWKEPKTRGIPRGSVPREAAERAIREMENAPRTSMSEWINTIVNCKISCTRTIFHGWQDAVRFPGAARNYWEKTPFEPRFFDKNHWAYCIKCRENPTAPGMHNSGVPVPGELDSCPHRLPWLEEEPEPLSAEGSIDLDTMEMVKFGKLYEIRENLLWTTCSCPANIARLGKDSRALPGREGKPLLTFSGCVQPGQYSR